ncbi:MAG: hypothetical protein IPM39_04525 [Chloroflexi bacterium]|nr:hypothetical protein [Chloroflexota bacterium]
MEFNEAVKQEIKKLKGKPFSSYRSLFKQVADYFIDIPSFMIDVNVIITTAGLLNDLYSRAVREKWDIDIREVLREDALSMAGLLVRILNRHPGVTREQYESFDTYVKRLGEILDSIWESYM